MPIPILATKLYIPPPRPNLIPRPRLIERLDEGLHLHLGFARKLTLISAPAGFGKTTLVSEWVASCERPVAWLSLDEGDSDLQRFLAYLVAALQTVAPHVGKRVLAALQSPQADAMEGILTGLVNEIAALPDPFVLVLDDYHVVDGVEVDETLTFLLDHLPPQLHVLITTREDPQLPLARMRGRGQLAELRVADLRFTLAEAADFLNRVMGLALAEEQIAALEGRTEGWIAGLQLAALSMRGRQDIPGFIKAFAGDNRYVVDYLVEEVLERQPQQVRRFLLQTSILERLNGPLCDAVRFSAGATDADAANSQVILQALERANLFVVPLDDIRQWYRYHHLFAGVLRARLMEEQPDQVATLHLRASAWYEQNASLDDAVRHAFAARNFERAADLVEMAWGDMDRSRQSARWLRWARALPDDLVRARPVLCAGFSWALLDNGELEAGEARLRHAEQWLELSSEENGRSEALAEGMVVVDEDEFRSLPGTIASARAYISLAHDDVRSTTKFARQALAFLPVHDYLRRGIPASLLGLATWSSGDLESAYRSFAEAMRSFERAGNVLFAITGTYILADIRMAQGRLRDAIRVYEESLNLALSQGEPLQRGTADLYLGLSELNHEAGNLQAATEQLRKSEGLRKQAALPRWQYRWCLAQARIKESEGDLDAALGFLDEAERLYLRGPVPDTRPIAALKARLWASHGRLDEARRWMREQGLSADDQLTYLREFEHMTLARVLIAEYQHESRDVAIQQACCLLERLLHSAEAAGRRGSAIEIQVLQALAHHAHGDQQAALTSLARALALAEPEGYVGVFRDEGTPMVQLLSAAAARGVRPGYTARLLTALGANGSVEGGSIASTSPSSQPLVEPLSQRELEVLALLAEGLSNREIGERLFLALSTVKGHNRNIYGKLQVKRRTEAVARARELGLL